jgi:UDP-N-acetylmuramyl tripeptide synthase
VDTPPFDDSRRLAGPNLHLPQGGALLDTSWPVTAAQEAAWRSAVAEGRRALGWPDAALSVRRHAGGASLALAAPVDQWLCATHVNEWAWHRALGLPWTLAAEDLPEGADPTADALSLLRSIAAAESEPALTSLLDAAARHGVDALVDDDTVSLGLGRHARCWPRTALPSPDTLAWDTLARIPTLLITGTNGKTTSARLAAAMAREAGHRVGLNSTEGLWVDDTRVMGGDCAGPDGARAALRAAVDVAVVETARGGLLRRGLALARASVALITNVGDDHLGEYGIDRLDDMADVKWLVAGPVAAHGVLVLNADDARLRERAARHRGQLAWFALDDDHPTLQAARAAGRPTCGVRGRHRAGESGGNGSRIGAHLHLVDPRRGLDTDLGALADMPITHGGLAHFNIANTAAAALAAHSLGVPVDAIRATLARFGSRRADNAGRLERWRLADVQAWLDFAHNPDGLAGLMSLAWAHTAAPGRLWLVLGQAGNRSAAELDALAAAAAAARPAHVVVKDLPEYARGRPPRDISDALYAALLRHGVPAEATSRADGELQAVRTALAAVRAGDTLVLPVHADAARVAVRALLDGLQASGWRAGDALPTGG